MWKKLRKFIASDKPCDHCKSTEDTALHPDYGYVTCGACAYLHPKVFLRTLNHKTNDNSSDG